MPNVVKKELLDDLRERFGLVRALPRSQSLFVVGEEAARIYVRYSKVHGGRRAFFGLRAADLRQLEGQKAFLCFLLDDGSPPLFVPYDDFEEVFRNSETAADGQYKVQLFCHGDARELYIARRGRFNLEAYVGLDSLVERLDHERAAQAENLSHAQVQTLLGGIGRLKGYDVYVPPADVGSLDWSLTPRFPVRESVPRGNNAAAEMLTTIDVVWMASGRDEIQGLFEVEHSTPIYSGLLRFNDVLLSDPRVTRFVIASKDARRALFVRQLARPTFQRSGLAELVSFLDYCNVLAWHSRFHSGVSNGRQE